ncbi:hypothetical protein D3C87_1677760 [compost metagenome]
MPSAVIRVVGSKKSFPINRKATYILKIDDILEPCLCRVVPNGMTTLAIASGIPIFFAAIKLAGIVAKLLHEPRAVNVGTILFFQNEVRPYLPLEIKANMLKPKMK